MRLRRGFTLIELLVVIAIILILAGMLMAGLMLLKEAQRKAETRKDLDEMKLVLSTYIDEYACLGDMGPAGFVAEPMLYLHRRMEALGRTGYEMKRARLAKYESGTIWSSAIFTNGVDQATATHQLDPWKNPYRFTVAESRAGGANGPRYVHYLRAWSTCGTPDLPNDDLSIFMGTGQYTINGTVFTATPGQWEDYNRVDFVLTAPKTINPATQTFVAWTNSTVAGAP